MQPLGEIEDKIVKCLKEAGGKDLSVNDIAKKVGVNRLTASKYLAVLQARGVVVLSRNVGRAKMFQLSPHYTEIITPKMLEKEKRMVKVEFLKDFPLLGYKRGTTALLEESQAREFIRTQYAREVV